MGQHDPLEPPVPSCALNGMLEQKIGYQFKNKSFLKDALTHPSKWHKNRPSAYERLEFLGDRVLGLVVAELLIKRFPQEAEGALAKRLTGLVREESLTRVAQEIEIAASLDVAGEDSANYSPAVLADACEALIGALYLDGGLDAAAAFIQKHWKNIIAENVTPPEDPKNKLQEYVQARGWPLPLYEVIDKAGPAHNPHFKVRVTIEKQGPAIGEGPSRRAAEKAAAQLVLENLKINQ